VKPRDADQTMRGLDTSETGLYDDEVMNVR